MCCFYTPAPWATPRLQWAAGGEEEVCAVATPLRPDTQIAGTTKTHARAAMRADTRRALVDFYAPFNAALAEVVTCGWRAAAAAARVCSVSWRAAAAAARVCVASAGARRRMLLAWFCVS